MTLRTALAEALATFAACEGDVSDAEDKMGAPTASTHVQSW